MSSIVLIGNVIKEIENNNIKYTGGIFNAAMAALKAGSKVTIITNIKEDDSKVAFTSLIDKRVSLIISDYNKTTTVINNKVVEIANTISYHSISKVKADYYYFVPTLNSDIEHSCFENVSKLGKVALSITGFMNFVKDECIKVERYQEISDNLKYISHLEIDKDQCFIQEFSHDEDHVAKKYAAKGCGEVLVPYYEALFNLRDNFFYRCKYVVSQIQNRDKIGDIALAAYISKQDSLIKEEALFYATALCCFYMDNKDISTLSDSDINAKMIDIGIV